MGFGALARTTIVEHDWVIASLAIESACALFATVGALAAATPPLIKVEAVLAVLEAAVLIGAGASE